ncbi:50S ribosomal protein L40e [Candidatus Micrarchaeota archaeon]|nr:50S ribosomal protein L40e [Candidatus Micrarchaeota archaeon]
MAVFVEARERKLRRKICKDCSARNPWTVEQCRKCGSRTLRPKKMERKAK